MKWVSIILTAVLCFVSSGGVSAQRTLPGQRGLQLTAGSVNGLNPEAGFYSGIAFSQYTKGANKWAVGVEYLEKQHPYRDIHIPQSQFTVDAGYCLKFLSDASKTVFFSAKVSAIGGYETVNWDKKLLFDGATIGNEDAFLYGGAIGLEMETYLSNRLVLLLNARERLLWGSSINKFHFALEIGIKVIIN
ncbi:conjugal transfer protein [Bacteroidia bacterium]|nr:conjugal transfer protein [Bacteroidia bacterium]GHT63648.1 conjugal transfer protein [Bacteroidia bacterium]